MLPIPMMLAQPSAVAPVVNRTISAGDYCCIKFTATGAMSQSTTTLYLTTDTIGNPISWTGQTNFANTISFAAIYESGASPILINSSKISLSAGNQLFTISTITTNTTNGTDYWLIFQIATGCTVTLNSGSNIVFKSTSAYVETQLDNSFLSITY